MEPVNYKRLYLLQDKILQIVFQEYTEFYLTGGTCLSRFYFEKRFSNDLDFFTNSSHTFAYSAREIISRITQSDYTIEQQVDSKDVFDLYLITRYASFNWSDILAQAKEKLHFQKEDLLYRLETFPLSLLEKLHTNDDQFLHAFKKHYSSIVNDIRLSE